MRAGGFPPRTGGGLWGALQFCTVFVNTDHSVIHSAMPETGGKAESAMRIGFISSGSAQEIAFAEEHELASIEINIHQAPSEYAKDQEAIHERLHKHGIELRAVGIWGRNFISDTGEERRHATEELLEAMDFAKFLGATVLMVGGGQLEDAPLEEKLKRLMPQVPAWLGAAKERGLKLAFYNCHWTNFVYEPAAWEPILGKYDDPDLGIKFDPSHPYHDGRDYLKQAADFGHKFLHVHAKDVLTAGGEVVDEPPAGLGDIEWGRLIGILYKHGYDGHISIEPHSRAWTGDRVYACILLAQRHLQQFLA